jgi:hypothetical protein
MPLAAEAARDGSAGPGILSPPASVPPGSESCGARDSLAMRIATVTAEATKRTQRIRVVEDISFRL